jgi:2-deoxy-D-gluconate 3-dehydrogenase
MTGEGRKSESAGIEGRRAVVTGASRGIGLAIAEKLGSLGAELATIQRGKGFGHSIAADLGDAEEATAASAEAIAHLGGLDICVCAAGVSIAGSALKQDVSDFSRVIAVNLTSAFIVSQAAARQFVSQKEGGKIVHLASEYSFFGAVGAVAYSASKGGVAQLAKSQSNEWADRGIQVNAVAPGWIETEMTRPARENPDLNRDIINRTPMGRWGQPSDIAEMVAWLVSPAAAFVSGAVFAVDGGYLAR